MTTKEPASNIDTMSKISTGERNDRVVQLKRQGWKVQEIATEVGISRQMVYRILKEAGLTRPRREYSTTLGFLPPIEHRRSWFYNMIMLMERAGEGEEINPAQRERLAEFLGKLDTRVWTYRPDEGFVFLRRNKAVHGSEVFIPGL